jgi:hypothetical protein
MIYDECAVEILFQKSLLDAKEALRGLRVHSGREPSFSGLSGWVYEQTIRYCILNELKEKGIVAAQVLEQQPLGGRKKVDLLIDSTAIEIKTSGLFGSHEIDRYKTYQSLAAAIGYRYLLLSRGESTYRTDLLKALGKDNVILLDERGGAWRRLIGIVAGGIKSKRRLTARPKGRA